MPDLDSTTRERLADLRRLLRDAQARSHDRTSAGQHTAIVLLDAACEHAVALAGGHKGLPKVDKLEATMHGLRELLPAWQVGGWKGVLELRGQRNLAQHRGVRPDSRDVARWSDDAEAFVHSLLRGVFDVELSEIAVADGVQDADVRRLLHAAEQALDAGDFAEAKYSAVDALDVARERWRGKRPRSGVPWYDRREQDVPEGVMADLERLGEQAEVQPFAIDYGEYLWLKNQHRRYTRAAPVPVDDALRALAFVTEWVLRWELFVRRNVNRDDEWVAQHVSATSGVLGARPSVCDVVVHVDEEGEYNDPAYVGVIVTLQDLPSVHRQRWTYELGQAMTASQQRYGGRGGASCDERGVLQFVVLLDAAPGEGLRSTIDTAISRADERWEEFCRTDRDEALAVEAMLDETREVLSKWIDNGTVEWVGLAPDCRDALRLRLSKRLTSRESYWTLEWLRERFGENEGHHRLAVGDDWVEIPVPIHDDAVGAIIADVLRKREDADADFVAIRTALEEFARRLTADLKYD